MFFGTKKDAFGCGKRTRPSASPDLGIVPYENIIPHKAFFVKFPFGAKNYKKPIDKSLCLCYNDCAIASITVGEFS